MKGRKSPGLLTFLYFNILFPVRGIQTNILQAWKTVLSFLAFPKVNFKGELDYRDYIFKNVFRVLIYLWGNSELLGGLCNSVYIMFPLIWSCCLICLSDNSRERAVFLELWAYTAGIVPGDQLMHLGRGAVGVCLHDSYQGLCRAASFPLTRWCCIFISEHKPFVTGTISCSWPVWRQPSLSYAVKYLILKQECSSLFKSCLGRQTYL